MIKVKVIFGKSAVNYFDETGKVPSNKWLNKNDGAVATKKFKTKEEYFAYCEGVNDSDGWEAVDCTEPQIIPQKDCRYCNHWRNKLVTINRDLRCPDCGELLNKPHFEDVEFNNQTHTIRILNVTGDLLGAKIGLESLESVLLNESREPVSKEAEQLDESILFYVPDYCKDIPDYKLAKYIKQNKK